MNLNASQVLGALNPLQPPEAMWAGIAIYFLMIMAFIGLFMQPEGSTRDTFLLSSVILFLLIDKIVATSNLRDTIPGLRHNSFLVFIFRVFPMIFPWIVAGSTKNEKSRVPLILTGLFAAIYLFTRWFFEIRPQG